MNAVDAPVRDFSIALQPTIISAAIFFVALAVLLAAGAWFGKRLYLHLYGVRTEGTVKESWVKHSRVSTGEFSGSSRVSTRRFTVEYTGSDGKRRIVKGRDYSSDESSGSKVIPRPDAKVPVFYSRTNPDCAVYYDPVWHYIGPGASLVVALMFVYFATGLCYRDIRLSNQIIVERSTDAQRSYYQDVISECYHAINQNPEDAAAYERSGDARFAIGDFYDAIDYYSRALSLRPDRREILRKRAKAEWLHGRDRDALRDWMKSI